MRTVVAAIIFFIASFGLTAQDLFPDYAPIYKDDIVARVDITLPEDSLAVIYAPGNEESEYHFHATFMFHNGMISDTFENAGFQLRGNTSRYADKKSFQISLNTYVPGRKWYGVEKINLNGEHNDPTVSRSKLCWDLLRNIGVPAPRSSHVRLYINDRYYGLYANVEHIDEEFVQTRFGNNDGNLYKCLWPADLQYLGSDPELYKLTNGDRRVYELKTNEEIDDYSDLAHFIDVLNNTPIEDLQCELEEVLNVNSMLLSIAFDILSGNWDGPLFNKNNFFLYHNLETGLFEYMPYDLDNTFGIDWFGINWATRNIYSWGHPTEPRPLYWRILEIPEYKKRFSYYLNQIIGESYREAALFPRIDTLKTLLAPSVADDEYYTMDYGFSIDDFNNGFGQTLPYFHTPVGIKPFIATRRSSTLNQLVVEDIAPIISAVTHNDPDAFEPVIFQASVEDDQGIASIQVCYRLDGIGPFTCFAMEDDGQYPDEVAGDGRYGVLVPATGVPAILSYTIVALDINDKQSHYPVCGTKEFMISNSSVALAVNEFMASNETTIADEFGDYEDWVEIYNYGTEAAYLGDLYLTDNESNPTKWQFPDTTIGAGAYLLIWADDEEEEGALHAAIKLSAGGEYIGIFDSDTNDNALIDGLDFGQQEADVSFGRLPNGTGPFMTLLPTPGSANEGTSSAREESSAYYMIYPNPTHDVFYLQSTQVRFGSRQVILLNVFGQVIIEQEWKEGWMYDVGGFPDGVYILGVKDNEEFKMVGKLVKE